MAKVQLGPRTSLYPLPTLLIGANVNDKPNFMAVAWGGVANADPPMVAVAIRGSRHTHQGIRQSGTFSVNIPSAELLAETDYCGIASGARTDKVADCHFGIFYGKLGKAPMIEQCPVNLECKVVHALELGSHTLFVGSIEETHVSENCLTDGKLDVEKLRPIVYLGDPAREYHAVGEVLGRAFRIGQEIKGK
jgi:flavin reductase (DIM6/NTAB) family NADH-FMN oxidoreductase RutF